MERIRGDQPDHRIAIFADALSFVESQYVKETDPTQLIYGAMEGMLYDLDAHSQFLTPEEYNDLKVDTQGKFGGVGVEMTMKDDLVTIVTAIEDTPAWRAGIKPNDRLVKIDETVLRNASLNDAVKMLRGRPGTAVRIVVWREREGRLLIFSVKRSMIKVQDIKDVKMLDGDAGYLKLVEFREGTAGELLKALNVLKQAGAKSLIIDLRNNPGGLLESAVEVAETFLPEDYLIVAVKGRDESKDVIFRSRSRRIILDVPMALLINEGSASGSEIVAAALREHDRAILLGSKTFGKGSVQTVLPLADGCAIKLTTHLYYTPEGHTIQDNGIEPDFLVESAPSAEKDERIDRREAIESIFERIEEQAGSEEVLSPLPETDIPDTQDLVVARARDLLKNPDSYRMIFYKQPQVSQNE